MATTIGSLPAGRSLLRDPRFNRGTAFAVSAPVRPGAVAAESMLGPSPRRGGQNGKRT